ncbi:MAG: hypothetical protein ACLFXM_00320 [Acidimicrobiia bacterium]
MRLRPGMKLYSTVCDAQVVVVKAPADDVAVACGGAPMVPDDPGGTSGTPDASLGEGPAIGKRYAGDELGIELLCSRAGRGALTVNGEPLLLKGAKPLPSSD